MSIFYLLINSLSIPDANQYEIDKFNNENF